MARRRHTPEQVYNKFREVEVAIAEGSTALWATDRRRLKPSCVPILYPCLSD